MEYVLKTYPDVVRLMLGTSVHFSEVNFNNYIKNGFPVDSPSNVVYQYLPMVNTDADNYPSDSPYINSIGDTRAWDTWNDGRCRWQKIRRIKIHGHWRRNRGYDVPTTGGYGIDKHTLVCEFPPYLLLAAAERREKAAIAKEKLDQAAQRLATAAAARKVSEEAGKANREAQRMAASAAKRKEFEEEARKKRQAATNLQN